MQTLDVKVDRRTKFEELAFYADGTERPSKFGGSDLERAIDNAAAELNFEYDAAQFYVFLPMYGSYTLIDRVLYRSQTAIYLDGVQHDIRADAEAQDFIQRVALESMGWKVIRLKWVDIQRDPIGAAQSTLYVQ